MAAKTLEGRIRDSKVDRTVDIDDEERLALAYAEMGLHEWQKALDIFEHVRTVQSAPQNWRLGDLKSF